MTLRVVHQDLVSGHCAEGVTINGVDYRLVNIEKVYGGEDEFLYNAFHVDRPIWWRLWRLLPMGWRVRTRLLLPAVKK